MTVGRSGIPANPKPFCQKEKAALSMLVSRSGLPEIQGPLFQKKTASSAPVRRSGLENKRPPPREESRLEHAR